MKYITAVFYSEKQNKTRKDKVIYFTSPADNCLSANSFSAMKARHVINAKPKAENVTARTFVVGAPSYDLR